MISSVRIDVNLISSPASTFRTRLHFESGNFTTFLIVYLYALLLQMRACLFVFQCVYTVLY